MVQGNPSSLKMGHKCRLAFAVTSLDHYRCYPTSNAPCSKQATAPDSARMGAAKVRSVRNGSEDRLKTCGQGSGMPPDKLLYVAGRC